MSLCIEEIYDALKKHLRPFEKGKIMRHSSEKIKKLIDSIREANSPGVVCDSVFRCEGWEKYYPKWSSVCMTYKFCPWCGKEITRGNDG